MAKVVEAQLNVRAIEAPIQVVGGILSCPHCASDAEPTGGVALSAIGCMVPMRCSSCRRVFGLEIERCEEGHAHIRWVEQEECLDPRLN